MDNGSVELKAPLYLSVSFARSMFPACGRFLSHIVAPRVEIMKLFANVAIEFSQKFLITQAQCGKAAH